MSYRRLIVLYALILIFVAAHAMSLGEANHGEGQPSGRPQAEIRVPDIAKSIARLFPMFTEASATDRYKDLLPAALNKISSGDEDPIAGMVAELFGTLSDQQFAALMTGIEKEIKQESEKPKETQNPDLMKFLLRIKEAGLSIQKTSGSPELAKFREAFEKKHASVQAGNKRFYDLLEQALTGNNVAKQDLLDPSKYDQALILPWLKEQCNSGNDGLCEKVPQAIAFQDEKTGEKFFDVVNKSNNQKQRLVLGKDNFKDALSDLSQRTGGFSSLSLASAPHDKVDVELRAKTGKPKSPSSDSEKEKTKQPEKNPAPPKPKEAPEPDKGPSKEQGGTSSDALKAREAEVSKIIVSNCVRCHSGPRPKGGLAFRPDGTPDPAKPGESPGSVESKIVERVLKDKDMPPTGPLPDAQLSSVREWAKLKGLAVP